MANDPYVYPGTEVLRNRLGLRDGDRLAEREARITTARTIELAERPVLGVYDLAHLREVHRRIFSDIYPWAGEIRSVAIAKGDLFALPQHIEPYLSGVLNQLPAEQFLRGLPHDALADRLTYYLAELNSVHPFREGNGRTQRAFLEQLAVNAGHHIDWTRLGPEHNVEISQAAHRGDLQPMRAAINQLLVDHQQLMITDLHAAAAPKPNRAHPGATAQSPPAARHSPSVSRGRQPH